MISTTLNKLKSTYLSSSGWRELLESLGKTKLDDEVLPFSTILESIGLEDTLWCCQAEPKHNEEWLSFILWCTRRVTHLLDDPEFANALKVAEKPPKKGDLSASRNIANIASRTAILCSLEAGPNGVAWAVTRDAQIKKFLEIVT